MNLHANRALLLAFMATASSKAVVAPGAAAAAAAQSEDRVVLSGANAADDIVLRVYGQEKGGAAHCRNASFALLSGPVVVGNMVPSANCESEVTVFSTRHAPLTAAASWSDEEDTVVLNMGPALREVQLDIYLVTTRQDAEIWARRDVDRANRLYAKNRVGLTFTEGKFRKSTSLTEADLATIGTSCDNADALKGSPSLYNPDRINVYFVPSIGEPETPRGFNCYEKRSGNTDGAPNIIYVSSAFHSQNTLAHELGHAFGLQGSTEHTGDEAGSVVPGFEKVNVMWTSLSSANARAQSHFSLGQAFRMIADERSWLNRSGALSGTLKPRECHPTRAKDLPKHAKDESPCPPLAFDAPEP